MQLLQAGGVKAFVSKLIFRSGMYSGKNLSLPEGKAIVLGRNRDVDLPLNDPKLSRRHCQLVATETGCVITDLGSTNGTFVNGTRLDGNKPQELIEFDRIVLGDTEIELYVSDPGDKSLAISSDDNMPVVKLDSDGKPQSPRSPTDALLQAVADLHTSEDPGAQEILSDPDPLLAALYEMGLPLPPEPADPRKQTVRSENVFCAYCGGKITEAERTSGKAQYVNGKWACKSCMAHPKSKQGTKNVSALLAGLDQEPQIVDTTRGPRRSVVEHDAEALRPGGKEPPPAPKLKPEEFGDEFEEIG